MLHDKYLPHYHFSEKHSLHIRQSPGNIYSLVNDFDFGESIVIRTLFKLRGLGGRMTVKQELLRENFTELECIVPTELILGLAGQFWKPNGNLQKVTPEEFMSFNQKGFAKATWNFELVPLSADITELITETRILCLGEQAHRRFATYWFFVRPFSGLIRKEMLRAIRNRAERLSREALKPN